MSLIFNFKHFFTHEYPNSSIEELEEFIQEANEDIDFLLQREKIFHCECHVSRDYILTKEQEDGGFLVEFSELSFDSMCSTCEESTKTPSLSPVDEYHPLLMLEVVNYTRRLFEVARYCKQQKYYELSDEDLQQKMKDAYDYSRYLRSSEKCFDSGLPDGFLDHVEKNTYELEALEFEIKARNIRVADFT